MKKIGIKIIVNILLTVSFIITAASAFMGRSGREIHEIFGIIFIILTLVHCILNWKMFINLAKVFFKEGENVNKNN